MKMTLPVYYTPRVESAEETLGELTFTTLSVKDHAALEGHTGRIHEALRAASQMFQDQMTAPHEK